MKRDTLGTLRARIAELEAGRQIDRQRLWDLVRLQRHALFESEAITPEEFALLVQDHPAVARLESYDDVRQKIDVWRRRAEVAEAALAALVHKLDEVHADPRYQSVWTQYWIHGGRYTAPKYEEELNAARVVVEGKTNAK